MSLDTLKSYEELLAAGVSEAQAKAQVYILNDSLKDTVSNKDLQILEKHIEAKFRPIYWIGTGMFTVCCLPILERLIRLAISLK